MALKIGSKAPDFTLPSTSDPAWNFYRSTEGQKCVLYFYPKDFTPGCTAEACSFRDQFSHFRDLDIPVIGISRDTLETHQEFKEKYALPFELVSDSEGIASGLYDANLPFVKITKRITYLIDEQKEIVGVYTNFFQAERHIEKMLEAI